MRGLLDLEERSAIFTIQVLTGEISWTHGDACRLFGGGARCQISGPSLWAVHNRYPTRLKNDGRQKFGGARQPGHPL